jgi:hypothetical protein
MEAEYCFARASFAEDQPSDSGDVAAPNACPGRVPQCSRRRIAAVARCACIAETTKIAQESSASRRKTRSRRPVNGIPRPSAPAKAVRNCGRHQKASCVVRLRWSTKVSCREGVACRAERWLPAARQKRPRDHDRSNPRCLRWTCARISQADSSFCRPQVVPTLSTSPNQATAARPNCVAEGRQPDSQRPMTSRVGGKVRDRMPCHSPSLRIRATINARRRAAVL